MIPLLANLVWDPVLPFPGILLLWGGLVALVFWSTSRVGPRLAWWRRASLIALRLIAVTLILIPLLQPSRERTIPRRDAKRVALIALDTSASMAERDTANGASRLDTARRLIQEHGLAGENSLGECRFFIFDDGSRALPPESLDSVGPDGATTTFHTSISGMLASLNHEERPVGLFVFSDGHDFQDVPPSRTGKLAADRKTPIYALPMGQTLHPPDVSVLMTSTQPSTFVGQTVRIEAAVRFRSCGNRRVRVELLRGGEVLHERTVTSAGDGDVPVSFDTSEPEAGQYEFEIRCAVQPDERDTDNNATFAFLNVTDARVPVLLVEGEPHWDTAFLQRTLERNERMSVDAIVAKGSDDFHRSRSDASLPPLEAPTPEMIANYPVVILGRNVERILDPACVEAIGRAVGEGGSTLVLARGNPGNSPLWEEMSPAPLGAQFTAALRILADSGSGSVFPADVLSNGADRILPPLPAATTVGELKTLASVEVLAEDPVGNAQVPAMISRPLGNGQVLAVTVDGLWKWALNPGAEPSNNVFDRLWNQLLLNLISRSSRLPSDQPQLTVSSANLLVGEQARLTLRIPSTPGSPPIRFAAPPAVTVRKDGDVLTTVQLENEGNDPEAHRWNGTVLASGPGRYACETSLPDGRKISCRFGARTSASETTDVAADVEFLRRLAATSGGRMLDAASLPGFLDSLSRTAAAERERPPDVRRESLWDRAAFFYLLAAVFGTDWFLRRRWGLV